MKQLSLFDEAFKKIESCNAGKRSYWKLFTDGAARNNPGPAGAGLFLLKDDMLVEHRGFYLGNKTNNQAEYLALLLGIFYVKRHLCPGDLLLIISDSQLLVRQIEGKYKVKNQQLKLLHALAQQLLADVAYNVVHVLREENQEADALANEGLDKKHKLPAQFLDLLSTYEIQV